MFDDTIFGNPEIHPESFVSSKSTVVGRVFLERDVIAAFGVKIRADEGTPFRICHGTNIQDGVTMHGLLNKFVEVEGVKYSIYVGPSCSVAHDARLHGPAYIGKRCFIGFDATVHASKILRNSYVGFQALVKSSIVSDNCHIGDAAKILGVKIGSGRYVADGLIINTQELADALPMITSEQHQGDEEFNKEVVDYNKTLIALYKERRKIRNGKWKILRAFRKSFSVFLAELRA